MAAVSGLAGLLSQFPGERIDAPAKERGYGWWLRSESGVLWRRLPAAALAGRGPGGVEVRAGRLARDSSLQRDLLPAGPRRPGIARFYDSSIAAGGLLGTGWRTCWDVALYHHGPNLAYHDEWGRVSVVPRPAPGRLVLLSAAALTFACLEDGRFVVADLTPTYRYFAAADATGLARLEAIEFPDGYRVDVRRDEQGAIAGLTDASQEGLWCLTDARGLLASVARGPSETPCVAFAYGSDGLLAGVKQGRGKMLRRYGYHNGLLSEIAEAGGNWSFRWRDEGEGAEVAGLREPGGQMWLRHRDRSRDSVRMVSAEGREMHWQFDGSGRVVQYVDAAGVAYQVDYDAWSRPVTVASPSGSYGFVYDDLGRVVQETGPGGFSRKVSYAYSSRLPMLVSRDGERHWFWMRDAQLRLLQRRAPDGDVIDHAYAGSGEERTRKTPGGEIRCCYDGCGRLKQRAFPDGRHEDFSWTADGQLRTRGGSEGIETREHESSGALRVRRGEGARMRTAVYDRRGNLLRLSNVVGHMRHWRYDNQGKLELLIDEEGACTRYSRVSTSRDLVVQGPAGGTQRWTRDMGGRYRARQDADGVIVEHRQDALGRVTRSIGISAAVRVETAIAYDAAGRVASREVESYRWDYEYVGADRLSALRATAAGAQESQLTFEYGADRRWLRETGMQGAVTTTRDALGHHASVELPCGLALLAARDAAQGVIQLSFQHDGKPVPILTFWQDAAGRERGRLAGNLQRLIERDVQQGLRIERTTTLSGKGDEVALLTRRLRRDAAGRLIEVQSATGSVLHDYDRRGQLVRTITEAGIVYTTWDAGGNIISLDGAGWTPVQSCVDHRVRRVGKMTLGYDEWGRVLRRDGPRTSAAFSWDAAGRLVHAQVNGIAVAYVYDAAGRLVGRRRVDQDDTTSHTLLWEGSRLVQEGGPGRRVTYLYEPAPAGWLSYAPAARLVQRRACAKMPWSAPEVQYLFADAAGRVHAVADHRGCVSASASWHPWGGLTGGYEADGTPAPPGLAGQWSDPDTLLCWNGERFYDPLSARYMSPDRNAPAGVSPYRYVAAPASQANPTGRAVRAAGISEHAGVICQSLPPLAWAGARPPTLSEPGD